MNIIDRRPNPKGTSVANRQRFLGRPKGEVKEALADALKNRKIADGAGTGGKVSIPARGISEPTFRNSSRGGRRDHVVPGNREFVVGDQIQRPQGGEGGGGGGQASNEDGGEQDAFEFALSKEEFLDLFFEDLELPDLIKRELKETEAFQLARAGFSIAGTPATLNLVRTMRNSLARRISLNRPNPDEVAALEARIEEAKKRGDDDAEMKARKELETLQARMKRIAFIDPVDVRYNRFERHPKPNTQAVMFCLMDVSGSMTEAMKDLAKRFFLLLHVFLLKRYKQVDIVFIRHTSNAQEVDEETFFHSRETGGTIVSTALEEMMRVMNERYRPEAWNIYAAQASDGDNYTEDSAHCTELMDQQILPACQYFAYIEVGPDSGMRTGFAAPATDLWRTYDELTAAHPHFSMRRVADRTQIFPVFHDLFKKKAEHS